MLLKRVFLNPHSSENVYFCNGGVIDCEKNVTSPHDLLSRMCEGTIIGRWGKITTIHESRPKPGIAADHMNLFR